MTGIVLNSWITSNTPNVTGGGGGGTTTPTVQIGPDYGSTSKPAVGAHVAMPSIGLLGNQNIGSHVALSALALRGNQNIGSSVALTALGLTGNQNIGVHQAVQYSTTMTAFSRSGTPDSDAWGDAWTDSTLGNTGVNHGNATPLNITGLVTGVNIAWTEIDLTGFNNCTATGNNHQVTFLMTNNQLVGTVSCNFNAGASVSRPFTESTITQSNQPATPTTVVIGFTSPAASSTALVTITMTDAQMQNFLGKWMLIALTGSSLQTATCTIPSREDATTSNRMTLSFTVNGN